MLTLDRSFGLVLCILLLLTGCKKNIKLVYVVPPTQDGATGYADAGQIVEWTASGQQFQITFGAGGNPCKLDDPLTSDGSKPVICHLSPNKTGTYSFDVGSPGEAPNGAKTKPPGRIIMHVGQCGGCTGLKDTEKQKAAAMVLEQQSSLAPSKLSVNISCGDTSASPGNAFPTPLTAKVGDSVYWSFLGTYPSGPTDVFDVTIPAGACSNYLAGTIIKSEKAFCQVAAASDYSFTAYGCTVTPGKAAISVQ